jgi:hypothetical protein
MRLKFHKHRVVKFVSGIIPISKDYRDETITNVVQ